MGLDHPHTKAGVGEFGVAISGGVWVAIREMAMHRISHCHTKLSLSIGLGKNRNTQSTSCVTTLQRVE